MLWTVVSSVIFYRILVVVGISCSNSYYLYQVAKKDKADYVAFGPTFKSKTKEKETISLLEFNKIKKKIKLPYVFIGGINHSNIKKLISFKPNNIAIIDSLWNFKQGPVQSALKFKENLEASWKLLLISSKLEMY